MATKLKGIDISSWQGTVDFKKVAADGIKFAVLREGYRTKIDANFINYVKKCQENNIYIMTYHFIYTDGATPEQNAESCYNNLKKAGLNPTTTWIAADLEYDTWERNGEKCTKTKCTKYTKKFLETLENLGCKKLFIYTNQDYYQNYFNWTQLKYPIWLADYNGEPNYSCIMQQYSLSGKVNGISGNVDLDYLFDENIIKEIQKNDILVTPDKVIEIAKAEVGYKEKASNSNLDNKTANAGTADYTKYARDFDEKYPNWYNFKKNGYAWCDMFVDWCFLKAFGYEKALELLCQPEKSGGAGCIYSYGYYNKKGQTGRTPKKGAQIFFGSSPSTLTHTGLVYDFDNNYVYTIEGNTSNVVAYRKYQRNASNLWYGYPKYSGTANSSEVVKKTTTQITQEVIDGKWGTGESRKQKLTQAGYDYLTIQTKVNELMSTPKKTASTTTTTTNKKADYAQSFNKKLAKTFTTTTKVNMRTGASLSKAVITIIPKDSKVVCFGYYTKNWYYVQYGKYTGFICKDYLK